MLTNTNFQNYILKEIEQILWHGHIQFAIQFVFHICLFEALIAQYTVQLDLTMQLDLTIHSYFNCMSCIAPTLTIYARAALALSTLVSHKILGTTALLSLTPDPLSLGNTSLSTSIVVSWDTFSSLSSSSSSSLSDSSLLLLSGLPSGVGLRSSSLTSMWDRRQLADARSWKKRTSYKKSQMV